MGLLRSLPLLRQGEHLLPGASAAPSLPVTRQASIIDFHSLSDASSLCLSLHSTSYSRQTIQGHWRQPQPYPVCSPCSRRWLQLIFPTPLIIVPFSSRASHSSSIKQFFILLNTQGCRIWLHRLLTAQGLPARGRVEHNIQPSAHSPSRTP